MEKIQERNRITRVHFAEVIDRNYYSIMLLAAAVSRQEWLAKEYLSGRINEKQFLETLLIEAPNRLQTRERDRPSDVGQTMTVAS